MPSPTTRRTFLKQSVVATAAMSLPRFSIGQAGLPASGKINVACIGIGNRGFFAVSELMKDPRVNIVAVWHCSGAEAKYVQRSHFAEPRNKAISTMAKSCFSRDCILT